jgi:hypothetical protein
MFRELTEEDPVLWGSGLVGYGRYEYTYRLGKYKNGKSCLHINKLADVDTGVLRELVVASLDAMETKYPR